MDNSKIKKKDKYSIDIAISGEILIDLSFKVVAYNYSIDRNLGIKSLVVASMKGAPTKKPKQYSTNIDIVKPPDSSVADYFLLDFDLFQVDKNGVEKLYDETTALTDNDAKDSNDTKYILRVYYSEVNAEPRNVDEGPDFNFYGGYYDRKTGIFYIGTKNENANNTDMPSYIPFMDLSGYINHVLASLVAFKNDSDYDINNPGLSMVMIDKLLQHLKVSVITRDKKTEGRTEDNEFTSYKDSINFSSILKNILNFSNIDDIDNITITELVLKDHKNSVKTHSELSKALDNSPIRKESEDVESQFLYCMFSIFEQIMLCAQIFNSLPKSQKVSKKKPKSVTEEFKLDCTNIRIFDDATNEYVSCKKSLANNFLDFLNRNIDYFKFFELAVPGDQQISYQDLCYGNLYTFSNPICSKIFHTRYGDIESGDTDDDSYLGEFDRGVFVIPERYKRYYPALMSSNFIHDKKAQYIIDQLITISDDNDSSDNLIAPGNIIIDEEKLEKYFTILGLLNALDLLSNREKDILDIEGVYSSVDDPDTAINNISTPSPNEVLLSLRGLLSDTSVPVNSKSDSTTINSLSNISMDPKTDAGDIADVSFESKLFANINVKKVLESVINLLKPNK